MADLGAINNYHGFSPRSHNWAVGMNSNMLKAAATMHLSVKDIVAVLPAQPVANDTYILTDTNQINVYADGAWQTIVPVPGVLAFVEDEESFYLFNVASAWEKVFDLNAVSDPIERNLSFYAPGLVRPNSVVFHYIPTMEFKLPAGAPHSYATLEKAPSGGNLVVGISSLGGNGTITFADGSTDGVFNVAGDLVFLPADFESMFSTPQQVRMTVGSNYGAEGLSVSLKGEIRAID